MNQDITKTQNSNRRTHFYLHAQRCLLFAGLIISFIVFCSAAIKAVGTLDPTFGSGGKVTTNFGGRDYGTTILVQLDGKILVVGTAYDQPTGTGFALARYNINGSLDSSFGSGGLVLVGFSNGSVMEAAVLQPDGKIVVVGHVHSPAPPQTESDFAILRLNPNGSLDTSFGTGGRVTTSFGITDVAKDVGLQSNGKIVVIGSTEFGSNGNIAIARYGTDGSLDTTFGTSGKVVLDVDGGSTDSASTVVIQSDDKIVVGGSSNFNITLLRYDNFGTLDPSFGTGGIAITTISGSSHSIQDLALQPDGKIVAAGYWSPGLGNFLVLRYLTNGVLDPSFGSGGMTSTDFVGGSDSAYAVAVRADGKIVVTGNAQTGSGPSAPDDFGTAVYNSDGSPYGKALTDFLGHGDYPRSVAFQTDGKILLAGIIDTDAGIGIDFGLLRYNSISSPHTPFDFDGDGKTDVSVYRSGGASHWYVIRSGFFSPPDSFYMDVQYGASGDLIAPADYDGDGKTNFAVFRPGTGFWYTSLDPAINYGAVKWGQSGDIPVPADYDGDGRADLAIYRPSTSTWWVLRSSDGDYRSQVFGPGSPVPGDFDGDGKTDFAYLSASGNSLIWNILRSSDSMIVTQQFGLISDKAVAADYDGDGRANIAVFRPSTGRWYTSLNPLINYGERQWGQNGDIPVPGDYDGDGKADLAVFRPSTTNWYILKSSDPLTHITARWGLSTDLSVPTAFVP